MKKLVGVIPIIVMVIGLLILAAGVFMFVQGTSATSQIKEQIAPLTLDQLDPTYDSVKESQKALAAAVEPQIKAGEDASGMYVYLSDQKLGLVDVKAAVGLASLMKLLGGLFALLALPLILVGLSLYAQMEGLKQLGAALRATASRKTRSVWHSLRRDAQM